MSINTLAREFDFPGSPLKSALGHGRSDLPNQETYPALGQDVEK
jgi:hypothetical protein